MPVWCMKESYYGGRGTKMGYVGHRFSALVSALNRAGHHAEVVQLVDEKRFSLNSAAAAEYLRALVETKRISKLAEGGAVE